NAPLFAIIAVPIIAEHWNDFFRAASPSPLIDRWRNISADLASIDRTAGACWLPPFAALAMLLVLAKPQLVGGQPLITTELSADRFPVAAVDFLRRTPGAVHGNMFNEYAWGGYFPLALPDRKIFMHPNLDVYGAALVEEFLQVNDVKPGWDDVLKKYNV